MAERKYASWSTVVSIIDNIKSKFSPQGHKHTSSEITDLNIPTKVSELTNDAGYVTTSVTDGLSETISGKANTSHTHSISDVTNLQSNLNAKVPTSRTINNKTLTSNITLSASDVSAYSKTEIDNMELITLDDIDAICGTDYQFVSANEVIF